MASKIDLENRIIPYKMLYEAISRGPFHSRASRSSRAGRVAAIPTGRAGRRARGGFYPAWGGGGGRFRRG